ncbi:MAG: LysR family transcriptional regulator [Burkholderiales bacterium]|jgi:DNA-binding transcriptional LysR family regulator
MDLKDVDLNLLPVFAAVADEGGFTAAADRLGTSKARVSLAIARLEASLGATLFARTTRRVAPTDAGRVLRERCEPLLAGLADAIALARGEESTLSGTLRIACSVENAVQTVGAAAARFAERHPALRVELRTADRVVDLVREGIDVAIRSGWLRDSTLRATRLGGFEQVVVAAPAYLKRAGTPAAPQDLAAHPWIALELLPAPLTWTFEAPRRRPVTVRTHARLRVDSPSALRAMVEAGTAVTVLDGGSAREPLRRGALVRLLPHWRLPSGGTHAVFPPGRHPSAAARAFVEAYRAAIAPDAPDAPGAPRAPARSGAGPRVSP